MKALLAILIFCLSLTAQAQLTITPAGSSGGLASADIDSPDELQSITKGALYPSRTYEAVEEFVGITNYWLIGSASGESAPGVWDGTGAHIGMMRFNTSTGAANRSILSDGHAAGWLFGDGAATLETVVQITTLSDGTESFTLRLGWGDTATHGVEHTDGVYFRYTHSVNSGNWQLIARNNSAETATNSSSTPVAGAWTRLTIVVNAAGTSAEFFVNGSSVGTVAANIPTAAGRHCGPYMRMEKTAGTTARTMFMDYIYLKKEFTTPR